MDNTSRRTPGRFAVVLLLLLAACTPAPPPPVDGTWTREPSRVPDTPGAPTPVPPATAAAPATTTPPMPEPTPVPHAELLQNDEGQSHMYAGVARVAIAEPCTGVLVETGAAPGGPAYVLTSGRCAGAWGANDVLVDRAVTGARVTFNYFAFSPERRLDVPVRRVAYATSKGTDLAVIELDATAGALAERGIAAWPLAAGTPAPGALVAIVGAPVETFAGPEAFLRRSICTLEERVDVLAGPWHWHGAYRDTCVDVLGGSAGAPVFDARDGALVALVAATAVQAETDECDFHRPCEVRGTGLRTDPGASYVAALEGMERCFDEQGVFALGQAGCPLDDGRQVILDGYPMHAVRPVVVDADGTERPRTWDVTLRSEAYTHFRYKVGPAAGTDCHALSGYGRATDIATSGAVTATVPTAEGHYLLCVLGGSGPGAGDGWQDSDRATVVHLTIDTTPPREGPGLLLEADEDGYRIFLRGSPPELAAFGIKMGPPEEVDCGSPLGYSLLRGDWFAFPHPVEPQQVCIVAFDEAGNAGEPIMLPLG